MDQTKKVVYLFVDFGSLPFPEWVDPPPAVFSGPGFQYYYMCKVMWYDGDPERSHVFSSDTTRQEQERESTRIVCLRGT